MEFKTNYTRSINRILIIFVIALCIFILHAGKSFIVPFVVALAIFFVLNLFEKGISKIITKLISLFVKKEFTENLNKAITWASVILAITISIFVLFSFYRAITSNFDELLSNTPKYQMLFNGKIAEFNNSVKSSRKVAKSGGKLSPFEQIISAIPESHLPIIDSNIINKINFNYIFNKIGNFAGKSITNSMLVIIYLIFLYLERRNFHQKIENITDKNSKFKRTQKTISKISNDLVKYFKIKTIASLVTAVLSYFVMSFFGLDFIWLWTFLIFALNFIPTIGSIIATVLPAILGLIVFNHAIDAVFMGLMITAIQIAIGNVIEPKFQGDRLNLSPLIILLSLAIWGAIWGVVGMFLAVPIMVTINAALAQFETTRPLAMFFSSNGDITD